MRFVSLSHGRATLAKARLAKPADQSTSPTSQTSQSIQTSQTNKTNKASWISQTIWTIQNSLISQTRKCYVLRQEQQTFDQLLWTMI
jgi:hypothetical protein